MAELMNKILDKYFLPLKSAWMRSDITSFYQHDGESLYDAWEWFKDYLRQCPHHAILDWLQIHTFYNGLNELSHTMIDAAASGSLNGKTPNEAFQWVEALVANNYLILEIDMCQGEG